MGVLNSCRREWEGRRCVIPSILFFLAIQMQIQTQVRQTHLLSHSLETRQRSLKSHSTTFDTNCYTVRGLAWFVGVSLALICGNLVISIMSKVDYPCEWPFLSVSPSGPL